MEKIYTILIVDFIVTVLLLVEVYISRRKQYTEELSWCINTCTMALAMCVCMSAGPLRTIAAITVSKESIHRYTDIQFWLSNICILATGLRVLMFVFAKPINKDEESNNE